MTAPGPQSMGTATALRNERLYVAEESMEVAQPGDQFGSRQSLSSQCMHWHLTRDTLEGRERQESVSPY